jgi:RNA polymerase sigma-70 factor, ECF subfamily
MADAWMSSYRLPLVGFVLPFVNGDVQAAEDVVQEAMLKGWQHAAELEPDRARSWLHTVARNIAISAYQRRRRARPPEVPLDENTLPLVDDGTDRLLNAWLVANALNSINPRHRAVLVELFYQRRSVAEVAALLAIPEGTVRSRCFYGLRALRKELERRGITRP